MRSPSKRAGKKTPLTVRELVALSLIAALMIALKEAMAFIPNVEPVSMILIACALAYGLKSLYVAVVFVLVEMMIYGFGMWTVNYIYIWPVLVLAVSFLRKTEERLFWAVFSGVYGLLFGALCAVPYLFIGGISMAFSYWVSGIPFDLLHGAGNFVLALAALGPCTDIIRKYGM